MPDHKETEPSTVKISVVNPGTPIRIALVFESVTTFAFATFLLVYPERAVAELATSPEHAGPLAETLVQLIAMICYAVVGALAAGIPNTPYSVSLRSPVYAFSAGMETLFIALFAWMEIFKGEHLTGVSAAMVSFLTWNFTVAVGWRVFVLMIMPDWFGRVEEVKKEE